MSTPHTLNSIRAKIRQYEQIHGRSLEVRRFYNAIVQFQSLQPYEEVHEEAHALVQDFEQLSLDLPLIPPVPLVPPVEDNPEVGVG
jgi:hypothetical protein